VPLSAHQIAEVRDRKAGGEISQISCQIIRGFTEHDIESQIAGPLSPSFQRKGRKSQMSWRVFNSNRSGTMCSKICSLKGLALAFAMQHGQAYAQASGCVVMEVTMGNREALTNELPPAIEKQHKKKNRKQSAPQGAIEALIESGSTDKDNGRITSSTQERAFASGQDLADYCSFKVETQK
jgi:hypothetical protein